MCGSTTAWPLRTLGELAEFSNGLNFTQKDSGNRIRVLGVKDFQDNVLASLNNVATISIGRKLRQSELLQPGDLVFVRSNGNRALIGRCLLVKTAEVPVAHSGFTIRARIVSEDIRPEFVNLCVRTLSVRRQIQTAGGGTNISNLNQQILASVKIPVPPLNQQERILDLFRTWDRAIEQTERLIGAKRWRKQALMQQLLTGKVRSQRGSLRNWRQVHLGEVFLERNESNRTDLPLASITANRGVIFRDELNKKDTSNEDKRLYKRIAPGDIGYNTMRMWQGVSALSNLEGIVSPAYTVCVPQEAIEIRFAAQLFKFPPMIHMFHRHSQGLVDDTLNLKFSNFAKIKVALLPKPEQTEIADLLELCDRDISGLCQKRDALHQQKRGLMQHLLTGKVWAKLQGRVDGE